jgi:diguanylate cyclase (GGDEF)-like protein
LFLRKRRTNDFSSTGSTETLLLAKLFEKSSRGWFWSTNAAGEIAYVSDTIAQLFRDAQQEVIGSSFADIFVLADNDGSGRRTLPLLFAKISSFEDVVLRPATTHLNRCWSISGDPQFDSGGRFVGYRGSAVDITENRISSEHASQLARYDALTGLPNRRRMTEVLGENLTAAEYQKKPCAVLLIDLDRFKKVNDTLGHPAGDALLKQVAERLVRIVGDKEKVFRLGGDEFQVVLQNCENRGIIGDLASDIIATLSQPYSVEGTRCIIGASVGIAVAPVDGTSKDILIRNADLALYASKSGGRGRFRFFSTELLTAADDKRILEEDLRDALQKGELQVAYQPIVNAMTNRMTGVEALMRWQHPTRGSVSPALFIPIAEEAGLVEQLGSWVLRKACEDAAAWPGTLRVAVNVSPVQFAKDQFPAIVLSALASSGLAPGRLELEITEGIFLGESSETDTTFAALKEIGVRLALDDFGTGYSSLGYLRTAPFDKIKIDQSFVRAATLPGSRNAAIIAAIVALAEALDMETTAEGVEYMDQLRLVRSLRVSHAQGWIYSKAISSAELTERLGKEDFIIEPSGPAKQRSDRQSVYRKVGVIDGHHYHRAIIRNLSDTGALIDGAFELAVGGLIVVDFGDGQLTFARVRRSQGRQHGLAFAQHLVDDGDGGLCTSHRVSPYLLSTVGLPSPASPAGSEGSVVTGVPLDELAKQLGLTLPPAEAIASMTSLQFVPMISSGEGQHLTLEHLALRYLETVEADPSVLQSTKRDLRNHILPRFGQLRLDQVSQADISTWLAAKSDVAGQPAGTDDRLHALLSRMWSLAVELEMPGAEPNPLEALRWIERRAAEGILSPDEEQGLLVAARDSQNRQLKFVVALLMLTGARQSELIKGKWDQIDFEAGTWNVPRNESGLSREVRLTTGALRLLAALPRWADCPYLVPNPITKKPYASITRSWDVVRSKACQPYLELEDLRYCAAAGSPREMELVDLVLLNNPGAAEAYSLEA